MKVKLALGLGSVDTVDMPTVPCRGDEVFYQTDDEIKVFKVSSVCYTLVNGRHAQTTVHCERK